jgi:hypothetical protein
MQTSKLKLQKWRQQLHTSIINVSTRMRIFGTFVILIYLCAYTYLLTPWSRDLLEKLTGFAASQEIPRIYGTPKFITVLTSTRHLSLS